MYITRPFTSIPDRVLPWVLRVSAGLRRSRLRQAQQIAARTHVMLPAGGSGASAPVSALLAQALREDSNLESDWLWLAATLEEPAERRQALERALAINPASELARRTLARLGSYGGS
jgi:hypothetical protein